MLNKKREQEAPRAAEACPHCAPKLCTSECHWAKAELRDVAIPFRSSPSKIRLVLVWCALASVLGAAVVAVLWFGTTVFNPPRRTEPAVSGI